MKQYKILSSLLAAGCLFGVSSAAFAASCSGILGPVNNANPAGPYSGNNCGNNAAFNGASTFCGGVSYSNTGTDVWQVNLAASQNFTFTVTSAAFTPDVALVSGSCTDSASCVNSADYSNGTGSVTTATYSGNPAGTYYVIITDSTATGAQCGAYNLSFAGTLPVKLQKFSVK